MPDPSPAALRSQTKCHQSAAAKTAGAHQYGTEDESRNRNAGAGCRPEPPTGLPDELKGPTRDTHLSRDAAVPGVPSSFTGDSRHNYIIIYITYI